MNPLKSTIIDLLTRNEPKDLPSKKEMVNSLGMGKGFDVDGMGNIWKPLGKATNRTEDDFIESMPGLVYPIVSTIAQDFAKIKLHLVEGKKDDEKEIEENPALTTLRRVNGDTTFYQLAEAYAYYMSLAGEVFWYMPQAGVGRVREIYTLNPIYVQKIKFDELGKFVSLEYKVNGRLVTYTSEEVIMDKTFNPGDQKRGFSPLSPIINSVSASESAIDYNRKFFENDATPSLLIQVKNKMNDAMKAVFKANWSRQFKGKDKAHKFALADADMEIKPLSMSNRDMSFKELMTITDQKVMSNWRVNKAIIGQTENINRATLEGAETNHSKRVVEPMMERFIAFLNEKYLPFFIDIDEIERKYIRFTFDSPVEANVALDSEVASRGVANKPYMTINEAREKVELPAIDEEEYNEIPQQEPTMIQPEEDDTEEEPEKEDGKLVSKYIEQNMELKEIVKNMQGYKDLHKKLREDVEKDHLERAFKNEPVYRRELNAYFDDLEERVMKKIPKPRSWKKMEEADKKVFSFGIDEVEEITIMKGSLKNISLAIALEAWRSADRRVPGHVEFEMESLDLAGFISESMNIYIKEVVGNSIDSFNQIFEEAIVTGASVDEITQSLNELFDDWREKRSKAIARTEVNNIANSMATKRYEVAQQDGLISKKAWLTVGDEQVREDHMMADGQTVDADKSFVVGGEKMRWPGDSHASPENRINCRCTIVPVL